MKKLFALSAGLFITVCTFAQVPQKMSYQAVIRDNSGQLVVNHAIGMQISILKNAPTGNTVYIETLTPSTNANGLVSVEIGNAPGFDTINWGNGTYFIKTETDPAGGTSYSISGTSQLLSVPYALHARTADSVSGGITETDPVFGASVAQGITSTHISNWDNAYSWGNHSTAGYLTSYTETDPVFGASAANGITSSNISNWDNAYSWGDHATAGYLTSYTETDPVFSVSAANNITSSNITNWNTSYGWGNHATAGYLSALQTGNSGKFLTTDGTNPAWSNITKATVGLGNVENTALSTWAGSSNILTLGTIGTGIWQGTKINASYIDDLPASRITSGIFDNARINWAAPGFIGSMTPAAGVFTSLVANNGLSVPAGVVIFRPSGNGGTNGQVLTTDGTGNATWGTVTASRPTRIITANTTLTSADELVIVRGTNVFVTLPASPANGHVLMICGYEATSGITIPGSQKIRVGCTDYTGTYTFNDLKNLFIMVYDSATNTWYMSL